MGLMRWLSGRGPYRDVAKIRVDDLEPDMIGSDVTLERTGPKGWDVIVTGTLQTYGPAAEADKGDRVITISGIEIHVDDEEKLEVTLR